VGKKVSEAQLVRVGGWEVKQSFKRGDIGHKNG